jgi:hypothetical protein
MDGSALDAQVQARIGHNIPKALRYATQFHYGSSGVIRLDAIGRGMSWRAGGQAGRKRAYFL